MSRALVIKNADFSVNKLDTVVFNDIPCTGISLSQNTLSMSSVGSASTLTATVTPADTSDAVVWSSSNTEVCTVAGGIITQTGCGTATITATCGNYSATCTVTAVHVASIGTALNRYLGKDASKDRLDGGDLDNYSIGFSTTGVRKISYGDRNLERYPILIPNGATKIEITSPSLCPYGYWLNTQRGALNANNIAYAYAADDFSSIPASAGNRSVIIPDRTTGTYEGADSCTFVFRYRAGTITQEIVDEVVVTFTA